jgi:NAD(P)H-dependent flavin oxidoreductase YrpB (nitropropane dioxygenase family)
MRIQTRFSSEYGLDTPIAQAGMAFVGSPPELAVAVSNAGALGSIAAGLMSAATLAAAIDAVRAGTGAPYHVNLLTPFTRPEHIEAVRAAAAPAVSFHWGHPAPEWIEGLHAAGVRVFEQVGTVEAARRAVGDGVDVVVAQGLEAGGHNFATLPTFAFVPLVVDAVAPALVLASGGIADGRGLAAALMLGADGVWVGSRFVATAESAAHPGYKARLVAAGGTDTALTAIFGPEWPDFNPMRVLRTETVARWTDRLAEVPTDTSTLPVICHTVVGDQQVDLHEFTNFPPIRETTGDLDQMALLAGQGIGLITSVPTAAAVVDDLTTQALAALATYRPG